MPLKHIPRLNTVGLKESIDKKPINRMNFITKMCHVLLQPSDKERIDMSLMHMPCLNKLSF